MHSLPRHYLKGSLTSMSKMTEKIIKHISSHPKASIVIVLAITAIMVFSIYTNDISTQLNEESFLPDMDVVNAYENVSSNYTGQYVVQILAKSRDGDILDRESLAEVFAVEEALLADTTIVEHVENPGYPEGNMRSLPTTLAVVRIVAEATIQGINNDILFYYPYNITQMKKALLGENISIYTIDGAINLGFFFTPNNIKESISLLSMDPEGKTALEYVSRTLTKDFNLSSHIEAEGCIILISLNPEIEDKVGIEEKINGIVKSINTDEIELTILGEHLITHEIIDASNKSIGFLMPIAFFMIIIVLLIVYRGFVDTIISLMALAFSIIWMYGFGAAFHFEFNPMTTVIPILLVGLGIDYGIHLTMRYREEEGERKERASNTLSTVGIALLLATLTTTIAFLSNVTSPIKLLKEFGILSAFGIFSSFIAMILFVPSLQQLRKRKEKDVRERNLLKKGKKALRKIIQLGARAGSRYPIIIIAIAIVITIFSGIMAFNLSTEFSTEEFLPEDLEITQDLRYSMENFEFMGGETQNAYIIIKGNVSTPSFYKKLNETVTHLNDDEGVVKINGMAEISSIATVLYDYATLSGTTDYVYNSTFSSLYFTYFTNASMPREGVTEENITMLYEWLYTYDEKLTRSVLHKDASYDATLMRISTHTLSKKDTMQLYENLKEDAKSLNEFEMDVTGDQIVTEIVEDTLNKGQINSLLITIITSFIILIIIFYAKDKSPALGFITAVPIIFCVAWILGAMYLMGLSLNVMTITIASLTVGLGVTYGIHVSHRFVEEIEKNGIEEGACRTMHSTGSALFGAAATTIAGFALLSFSLMPPMQQFGKITALTILFAFISAVFILPSFLIIWARKMRQRLKP